MESPACLFVTEEIKSGYLAMNSISKINVLATSAGNNGFPAVYYGLKICGIDNIIACDSRENPGGSWLAKKVYQVPEIHNAKLLIKEILNICSLNEIGMILPLSTLDQEFFATNKMAFSSNDIYVAVSNIDSIRISLNKHSLYKFLAERKYPIPYYCIPNTKQELLSEIKGFQSLGKNMVVKTEFGTGAQGVKIVLFDSSSLSFFDREKIKITYDDLIGFVNESSIVPKLMLTDYLSGTHYSVDCFRSKSDDFFKCVVRTEIDHLFGTGRGGKVISSDYLTELCRNIAHDLDLEYSFNIEFIGDTPRDAKILEINPRLPASSKHSIEAGLNMPYLNILKAKGCSLPKNIEIIMDLEFRHFDSGITFIPNQKLPS
jgi:hypothetical protein